MSTSENKLTLKVMVDSRRKKVVFAEADSDFVDILLSFLTLPLGTIIRRLNQHFGGKSSALGCFNNLYSSVENLNDSYFVEKEDRDMLLHPKNASQTKSLKLNVDDSEFTEYYKCSNKRCLSTVFSFQSTARCSCGHYMFIYPSCLLISSDGRVFTDSKKSFIISDDLRLVPSLDGLNVILSQDLAGDVDEFEEKSISIGLNEIMNLLWWSLISPTPLSNLVYSSLNVSITTRHSFQGSAPGCVIADQFEDSRRIVIKALVQKSINKLLFFVVGVDFVGFLFKLLQIPLGSVVLLLDGNSGLRSIDNLHNSVSKLSEEYLVSPRDFLIKPKTVLFYKRGYNPCCNFVTLSKKSGSCDFCLMDLMCDKQIIEHPSTFMVTDDLVVTPSTTMSIFAHLKSSKIPVSDVEELAINVGAKEASDILKASLLSSSSVLSNALQLMKQPKQEK